MTGKLVQQQMYTRERGGGIFLTSDGYDTIAISEGLDKSFVKKYLHPFCIYQSPKALTTRGEKDASLYPEAITLIQPETGDMVIGQSVFVPADFTGQRSAYFMHNYVIPANRKEEYIKQPEKLFQINEFHSSYNMEQGNVLPGQENIGYTGIDVLARKDEFLTKIGISDDQFKQLLFAVMSSIAGKKKVFISLNVSLQEYSKASLKLLELIYLYLPYAHRRKFGAMTFSSEPEGKNLIHVMFYEPGTLNTADRSIEKQFIFDFVIGRISGVEIAGQKHEYIDYALDHFSQSKRIDDFFTFAETALSGLPEQQQVELTSYYQLTDLYLTLMGSDLSFYQKNKIGFLYGLMKFLQVNSAEKGPLVELFVKLLSIEKYAQDAGTALDYIHAVVSINKIVGTDKALLFILDTFEFYRKEPLFQKLWETLERDKPAYEAIVRFIISNGNYEGVLILYLENRFRPINQTEGILNEIKTLLSSPLLLDSEVFHTIIKSKITASLGNQSDSFKSALAVFHFNMNISQPQFTSLRKDMQRSAMKTLFAIHPKRLTIEEIMTFGRIFPAGLKVNDERGMRNYVIIMALYQLLSNPLSNGSVILKSLVKAERDMVRETLQQLLKNKVTPEYFSLLSIAYSSDYGEVDYSSIFKHLVHYSDDKTVLAYIKENAQLTGIDKFYRQALQIYLVSNPASIWKIKTFRNELKLIRISSFKNLLKTVETETASPVVKFLRKNGIKLFMALVIIGAVSGGTWFGFDFFKGRNEEQTMAKTNGKAAKVGNKHSAPISLNAFKRNTTKLEEGQTFRLDLDGGQLKTIVGQAQEVTLVDNESSNYLLDFTTEKDATPFDKSRKLKDGFLLRGIEYDFDKSDKTTEVVLIANNESGESYLWIYSINQEEPTRTGDGDSLKPIYQTQTEVDGISDVKLDSKELTLTIAGKKDTKEFPFSALSADKQ